MNTPLRLSISLVCYRSDPQLLQRTLTSLQQSLQAVAVPVAAQLTVIDNGQEPTSLRQLLDSCGWQQAQLIANKSNSGFGSANNQAICTADSDLHLILNPDVELAVDTLQTAIAYLDQHPAVVAVSPSCRNAALEQESLCKRYPPLSVLLVRGFAPRWIKQWLQASLARYECRDLLARDKPLAVPLISGCFMLCRTSALREVGGFDEHYFLYFEDFALSLALSAKGELHHVPASHIVHHGGNAARKGWRHIGWFLRSACRFYQQYGWRL